jgi:TrmH family RNA methyltransferase
MGTRSGGDRAGATASLKRLRRLSRRRSQRSAERAFVIDGPVLLADALGAGVGVEQVLAEPGARADLLESAASAGASVRAVAPGALAKATDTVTPQPVAAIARIPDLPLVGALDAIADAGPLVLVLVGVADPGNAGTLLRSAEAAGAGAVVFCDGSVDPYGPKCVRSSAGAVFRVAVVREATADTTLDQLRTRGVLRVATVARGEHTVAYDQVDLSGPTAVVLGNEAHGLPPGLQDAVDRTVTIPMVGRTESLNVAMAGTILCFESLRQRRSRLPSSAPPPHPGDTGKPVRGTDAAPEESRFGGPEAPEP